MNKIDELRADFRGGTPGFRFVFVIAVFVVNVPRFAVFVIAVFVVNVARFAVRVFAVFVVNVARFAVFVFAVFVVNVSGFAVRVIAVGAVDVSGLAVVVRATGAVDVSGFAVRRARRDFAAEDEEGGDASDEKERERADGDEGGRGFRLVVVEFLFGHFSVLNVEWFFDFSIVVAFLAVFKARSTVN